MEIPRRRRFVASAEFEKGPRVSSVLPIQNDARNRNDGRRIMFRTIARGRGSFVWSFSAETSEWR